VAGWGPLPRGGWGAWSSCGPAAAVSSAGRLLSAAASCGKRRAGMGSSGRMERGRPLTSLLPGGLDPVKQPERRELFSRAVTWCFEPADQISACPAPPAGGHARYRFLIVGAAVHDVEDEPLFAERVAGIDIAKAGIEVTIRVPSDTRPGQAGSKTPWQKRRLMMASSWWSSPRIRPR
jgi:hypothetical protein